MDGASPWRYGAAGASRATWPGSRPDACTARPGSTQVAATRFVVRPVSAPDAGAPPAGAPEHGVLHALLRNGRGRGALLLALFLLVLFAAGRTSPPGPRAAPPGATGAEQAPRPAEVPTLDAASGTTRAPLPGPPPDAVAVDNLLARYDALIRLLEARALDGRSPRADSALAELRALRGRTYAAARQAVIAAGSPREP